MNSVCGLLRLELTLLLGLLGTWLMPIRQHFFPGVLAEQHGPALLVWLIVAFAGALLLHRDGRTPTPRRLLVFMGLAAAVALVQAPVPGTYDIVDWPSLAKTGVIALLLLLAGASRFGAAEPPTTPTPWMVFLLRGPALAVTSPLLLFASRPPAGAPGSLLFRSASALFLCTLASPLITLGRNGYPHALWRCVNLDNLGVMAASFVAWSWSGCAVLALLTPWPEPRPLERRLTRGR